MDFYQQIQIHVFLPLNFIFTIHTLKHCTVISLVLLSCSKFFVQQMVRVHLYIMRSVPNMRLYDIFGLQLINYYYTVEPL